ncbi:nuclear transport factor 2 family protein [Psychroserpens ponticola]|uniref:Nuclear transport factor 2 family protein n=1 Tax=Psychroserpens ponticola TaxID=2932268 RepID=A0ABY7RWW9_9FLAO|nr:nuclear transport factor 2 family protein [Psychroserpens ponticola]WCO01190.1 nuclear transport factor 2 family protein [Psychroserpens ponticola]
MNKITPPFNKEKAKKKVQAAEDAWNSKNPDKVSMAYSIDSKWRNREHFFTGRKAIVEFLTEKWNKELHYKLKKYLWSYSENRISVRFEYEWQDSETKQWKRTHGNEHWEFDSEGLMKIRDMSANDISINKTERKFN